jgi:hypothetical protein
MKIRWPAWERWHWPRRLKDRLRHRKDRPLVTKWIERSLVREGTLSFDQERRLQTEEWAGRRNKLFDQPHLVIALTLAPDVEIESIRRILNDVVSRESALRTAFRPVASITRKQREDILRTVDQSGVLTSGLYYSDLMNEAVVPLSEHRVETRDASPFADATYRVIRAEALRPFALDRPPLMRAMVLINLTGQRLLVIVADRLVMDWWSLRALHATIRRLTHGAPSQSSAPASQSDRPRRENLRGRCLASLRYWREQWRRLIPLTTHDFPFALPESLMWGSFECRNVLVPREVTERLHRHPAAATEGLAVLFLGAVISALHHTTQRSSVSIWTDFRIPWMAEERIASFSHSHMVTVDLTQVSSASDLIKTAAASLSQSHRHHDVPLDLVWRATNRSALRVVGQAAQISFQHLTFDGPCDGAMATGNSAWPLLETDQRFALQFRSYEEQGSWGIVATYDSVKLRRDSIDGLLSDISATLTEWSNG